VCVCVLATCMSVSSNGTLCLCLELDEMCCCEMNRHIHSRKLNGTLCLEWNLVFLNGTLCLEWNLVVELDEISVFNGTLCSVICLEWNLVVELDEISVLNGTLCSVISVQKKNRHIHSRKLTCSWHI